MFSEVFLSHSVRWRVVVAVFKGQPESSLSPLNLVGFPESASEILEEKVLKGLDSDSCSRFRNVVILRAL